MYPNCSPAVKFYKIQKSRAMEVKKIRLVSIFLLYCYCGVDTASSMDNGVFRTPPMGWLSWQTFRCTVDCDEYPGYCLNETLFKNMADLMISDGWFEAGYTYVNVDDCWAELERDPQTKRMVPDRKRFPSGMKALGDYIHQKGLKFGLYSDAGTETCAKYPGSYQHFEMDAQTFADWGVDSLKFDGCNVPNMAVMPELYEEMSQALNRTGRPIGYICSWPAYTIGHVNLTRVRQSCNSWRNFWDIDDSYERVTSVINWFVKNQVDLASVHGPGGWNDPDMLVIGNAGLSLNQARVQMAIWCITAAPLMMGNDLRAIAPEFKNILQNKELIAVNQDPLGIQGTLVKQQDNFEIWVKHLYNNDLAVVVTHRRASSPYFPINVTVDFTDIKWIHQEASVRDLFGKKDLGVFQDWFRILVEPEGASMVRLSSTLSSTHLAKAWNKPKSSPSSVWEEVFPTWMAK